jgi:3-phosphoshikimate 1-carboxyvinyltransferase
MSVAALALGRTVIEHVEHVRYKETDRVALMTRELRKMGASIIEETDRVVIEGGNPLQGVSIDHGDDHRIAMACAVAALHADSRSSLQHPEVVADSYPSFWSDLGELGSSVWEDVSRG